MRILILGPSGQIGYELSEQARRFAEVTTAGRSAADIIINPLERSELANLFETVKPDIVINAIAYTAVDKAECDQESSFQLNSDLPSMLADQCSIYNALFIHYSTDFVFDGTQSQAWCEEAATNPLSIYGRSKLAGEKAIQLSSCTRFILRTGWVYGARGNNFMLTMLRLAREREKLSVVDDQIGAPSCSYDIAQATLNLCQRYQVEPDYVKAHQGLYHLTAGGEVSWHGFAKAIFSLAAEHENLKIKDLLPIASDQYPTDATRPRYSVLNCKKILEDFNIRMHSWEYSLKNCIQDYYSQP